MIGPPAAQRQFVARLLWEPNKADGVWLQHIDGLRAIAVLSVVLYHSDLLPLHGGFVGVDVFFVISGFLISRIIYNDVAAYGRVRIVGFYERRVRRILPAFIVVTAATLIAGFFLFLPNDFAALGRSALYACAFSANIFFYLTSGYFDALASSKPLLHYWSLGVEEQFYVVFPLVVFAVAKISPRLLWLTVLVLGLVSFGWSELVLRISPVSAFYLPHLRAWELMAGCALALPGFPEITRRLAREAVAAGGLICVCAASWLYSDNTPFPGLAAALPVGGSAAILWACRGGGTLAGSLLSLRPLRWIGFWSYSIYMIHWPVIVFSRVIWPHGGAAVAVGTVSASLALGWASYAFVETPFRGGRRLLPRRPVLFEVGFAALASVAVTGLLVASEAGFPQRLPTRVQQVLAYKQYDIGELWRQGRCFLSNPQRWKDLQPECLVAGRRSVLLWGDSVAAHYYPALKALYPNIAFSEATKAGCEPMVGLDQLQGAGPNCRSFNDEVMRWTLSNKPEGVLLSSGWRHDDAALDDLDQTINALRTAGIPVIILGSTARYAEPVPDILAKRMLRGDFDIYDEPETGAAFNGDYYMKERYGHLSGVRYISSQDNFCRGLKCPLATPDGVPIYFDSDHFTREGAILALSHLLSRGLPAMLGARED